jgi:chromosome segregation ATPase
MQLPEIFVRGGFLLEILNTIGLGILGAGLVTYYRALLTRSDTLRESLNDLRSAHETVLAVMDKRAREIDARFEDEKKFQNFHLSLLEEVDVFRVKIRTWKEDEISQMHNKLKEMSERMGVLEDECRKLKIENHNLTIQIAELEGTCKLLEKQNHNLEIQAAYVQPGIKGVN